MPEWIRLSVAAINQVEAHPLHTHLDHSDDSGDPQQAQQVQELECLVIYRAVGSQNNLQQVCGCTHMRMNGDL